MMSPSLYLPSDALLTSWSKSIWCLQLTFPCQVYRGGGATLQEPLQNSCRTSAKDPKRAHEKDHARTPERDHARDPGRDYRRYPGWQPAKVPTRAPKEVTRKDPGRVPARVLAKGLWSKYKTTLVT